MKGFWVWYMALWHFYQEDEDATLCGAFPKQKHRIASRRRDRTPQGEGSMCQLCVGMKSQRAFSDDQCEPPLLTPRSDERRLWREKYGDEHDI